MFDWIWHWTTISTFSALNYKYTIIFRIYLRNGMGKNGKKLKKWWKVNLPDLRYCRSIRVDGHAVIPDPEYEPKTWSLQCVVGSQGRIGGGESPRPLQTDPPPVPKPNILNYHFSYLQEAATSQGWQLPKCAISQAAISQVHPNSSAWPLACSSHSTRSRMQPVAQQRA